MDPHTAVAKAVADRYHGHRNTPLLIAATAHFGKFGVDVLKFVTSHSTKKIGTNMCSLFQQMESIESYPSMHQTLKESVLKPQRHYTVLDGNIRSIVHEVRHFVKNW